MADDKPQIRVLEAHEEIRAVESVQRAVWGTGDVVPYHILVAGIHNGAVLAGAYLDDTLVGFVYGFPALQIGESERQLKHHSHMLAVLPEYQDHGIGFLLKKAQWQLVRRQGLVRITWTFDPLQSRNGYLNITRLGGVCSTYLPDYYGEMRDEINAGNPSDRFMVDWWLNSARVQNKMGDAPRRPLKLEDYFSAGAEILNPTKLDDDGWPAPPEETWNLSEMAASLGADLPPEGEAPPFYLVEIPPNFYELRQAQPKLGLRWRLHTRQLFTDLFARGYLVTDFIYLRGESPRSFYVLTDGERQLGAFRKRS